MRRSLQSGVNMSDRDTMKDVSHTAPNDTSAHTVWERGRVPGEAEEAEEEEE